jgi:hypothetical protein
MNQSKRHRNRLRALRQKAPGDRTPAEIRELMTLAREAAPFDPIQAAPKRPTRRPEIRTSTLRRPD